MLWAFVSIEERMDNDMEENKNPTLAGGSAPSEGGEKKRRRGHRGGRNHKKHKDPTKAPAENDSLTEKKAEPAPRKSDSATETKNEAKPEKKGDNRQKRNSRRKHGSSHRADHVTQKDDIYGDPKEERELAEWRAKIVLNAEPPVKSPLVSEKESVADEEPDVPLPEDIDLLSSSPVMDTARKKEGEQVNVIGVRFRSAGKMYYFDPRGIDAPKGTFAIVETARGPEFGEVCLANTTVSASETVTPLRPLLRIATPEDVAHNEQNREKEKEALVICQKKIEEHGLDMKLIDVQYAFDNSKLLFYFASEGRVDFRELVKDLASVFRTRIELRQIGIRDEAKMLGGFGSCGRLLCCSTFLPDFAQVSIKMAKEQGLSLNSAKISGMCGRLMCCLRFESEVYSEEIRRTPSQGSLVKTEDGIGTVISINPLAGTVRVVLRDTPDAPPKQYHRDTLTVLPREKHSADSQNSDK